MYEDNSGILKLDKPTNILKIRILKDDESNRVYWFETGFLSLVYL